MDVQNLMHELARTGVTVSVKCDGERLLERGRPWTFVASGGPLGEDPIRRDDFTLDACLKYGLRILLGIGPEWGWLGRYLP